MAITLQNADLRAYLQHLTGHRPQDGALHLLGIRSAKHYPAAHPGEVAISVQEPRPNAYDDLVGFFGVDLGVFTGTVDPGRNWTLYPMQPAGCAHVADGGPYPHRIGLHKGKPAFIQSGLIRLWRDRDRDGSQDPQELVFSQTGTGINVHQMGREGPGVNAWSAGCLGAVVDEWREFWRRATSVQQAEYPLWVIDGPKYGAWYDGGKPA